MQTSVASKQPEEDAAQVPCMQKSNVARIAKGSPQEYNPYLAARQEWDDRYGELAARAGKAERIAIVASIIALVAVVGVVAMALRPPKIIVVAVGPDGQFLGSGKSGQPAAITKDMKRAAMAEWVSNLRLVTTDGISQRVAIDKVYSMISSGSSAQTVVSDFYRAKPPQTHARTETVHIQVNSVVSTSDTSCQVEWIETTRDLQGKAQTEQHFKGIFTFVVSSNPSTDERLLRLNPIGLYITEANWSEVL